MEPAARRGTLEKTKRRVDGCIGSSSGSGKPTRRHEGVSLRTTGAAPLPMGGPTVRPPHRLVKRFLRKAPTISTRSELSATGREGAEHAASCIGAGITERHREAVQLVIQATRVASRAGVAAEAGCAAF